MATQGRRYTKRREKHRSTGNYKTEQLGEPGNLGASFSRSLVHSLLFHANAELIPGTNYFAVFDHKFKQFFALYLATGFVL